MSAYLITRKQFLDIMDVDPSDILGSYGMNDPVQKANWFHAVAFCNKLSLQEGLTPVYTIDGVDFNNLKYFDIPTYNNKVNESKWNNETCDWNANGYRLPTEIEWMWAAMGADQDNEPGAMQDGINRTGHAKPFAGYNGENAVLDYVWNSYNSKDGADYKTHPVGFKLPNELGLFDMNGNVYELCWDWRGKYPEGEIVDYKGTDSGDGRVKRGGSYNFPSDYSTIGIRRASASNNQDKTLGFRTVRKAE